MPTNRLRQIRFACSPSGLHGREDPPAGRVELLVGGTGGPQLELVDAVAGEAGVCVAVDQPRYGTEATSVELLELIEVSAGFAKLCIKVAHRTEGSDASAFAQDVRVANDFDGRERLPSERRLAAHRSCQLSEIADEEAPTAYAATHSAGWGGIGGSSPRSAANAIASG